MALFNRVTVWVSNQVLTASALNGEFNNILNNAQLSSWVGFSANVSQMQQMTNPGGVGTESLAGSGSDEVQRLRFMLAYILGTSSGQWYDQTGRNFSAGSLAVQSADIAAGAVNTAALAANAVTAAKIANSTITYAQIAAAGTANILRSQMQTSDLGFSSSSGLFSTTNTTATSVTNLSVTISTSGTRPVRVFIVPDGTINGCTIGPQSATGLQGALYFYNGSTLLAKYVFSAGTTFEAWDLNASSGTNTYTVKVAAGGSDNTFFCAYAVLGAYEIV